VGGLDRGRAADVFSMGCVWLEMYTVLLGESLESLENLQDPAQQDLTPFDEYAFEFYKDANADIKEGRGFGYAGNLRNVHKWVERLIIYCDMHSSLIQRDTEDFPELNVSCSAIISGLNNVKQMLQEDPINRPSTSVLCSRLGANRCCKERIEPIEIAEGFPAIRTSRYYSAPSRTKVEQELNLRVRFSRQKSASAEALPTMDAEEPEVHPTRRRLDITHSNSTSSNYAEYQASASGRRQARSKSDFISKWTRLVRKKTPSVEE
jgi:hypothetical protein